jgi:hypothetical protein
VDSEHQLEIEEFYFKLESSSEEEPEPSRAQYFENKSQQAPNIEQLAEPELELNPKPREQMKPEMSERGTPVAKSKSQNGLHHIYIYEKEKSETLSKPIYGSEL